MSDGKIDIQAPQQINITSDNTVKVEAQSIILDGSNNVQIKGDTPGECAVNAKKLYQMLMSLAMIIDMKIPGGHEASDVIQSSMQSIMNQQIQYI